MYAREKAISLHAEMDALFSMVKAHNCNRFDQKVAMKMPKIKCIYVVRLMNIKSENTPYKVMLGNSKPCENCQKKLRLFCITKVKYTDVIDGINVLCEMKL